MDYTASTAEVYHRSVTNPVKNPEVLAKRWASMKELFEKHPLAVNVAVVAGHDDLLIRALGDPGSSGEPNGGGTGQGWMFEDQTKTKTK